MSEQQENRLRELLSVAEIDSIEHNTSQTYMVRIQFLSEENCQECLRLVQDIAEESK